MRTDGRFDNEAIARSESRISRLVARDGDLSRAEALAALMWAAGEILLREECLDCRRSLADMVRNVLETILAAVTDEPQGKRRH